MNAKQKLHQIHLQEWTVRFAEQKASGLTVRQWCEQNHLSFHTYNYWKHLLKEEVVDQALPDIVPITLPVLSDSDTSLETSKTEVRSIRANRAIRSNDNSNVKVLVNGISIETSADVSAEFIISNATFPSYFLKDEAAVIDGHARLDLAVFTKIAAALNITARYVGEEPASQVTGLYNQIMCEQLPKAGIECVVVPRKEANGKAISASTVRQCLQSGDWDTLETLLPKTSLDYFRSPEAEPVLARIRNAGNVVHY